MRTVLVAALLVGCTIACREKPKTDAITLDSNFVTVDNRTNQEWRNVEVWLNHYYRATAPAIPAGSRFQAPLSVFVDGYARRFNFKTMQIRDVRLTATLPDGQKLAIEKPLQQTGLDHTLGQAVGKKP